MKRDYYYIDQRKMVKVGVFERYKHTLIGILFIIISFLTATLYTIKNKDEIIKGRTYEIENYKLIRNIDSLKNIISLLNETDDFSEEELIMMLNGINILFPEVVLAQSKLETSNYTSDIFLTTGNLFGMKAARSRPNTHYGTYKGHADYLGNWRLSVMDYALWQSKEVPRSNVKTVDDYLMLLELKGYAEDKNYTNKLRGLIVVK
jgi:hypothetical protein